MTRTLNNMKTGLSTACACGAADTKSVFFAGSFNGRNPRSTPIEQAGDGRRATAVDLTPNRFERTSIVDGTCFEPGREDGAGCPNCLRGAEGLHREKCVPKSFVMMNRAITVDVSVSQAA